MSRDAVFKVCIFGDGGVGKTALTQRYVTGLFKGDETMTIGMDFHLKYLKVGGLKVALQIWDFAGEARFRFLLPNYVKGASGGLFMYDITRYSSLKNLDDWLTVFKQGFDSPVIPVPIIMIGGKIDLADKRAVLGSDAKELAESRGLHSYIECSAKTGENVEEIFSRITHTMMKNSGLL